MRAWGTRIDARWALAALVTVSACATGLGSEETSPSTVAAISQPTPATNEPTLATGTSTTPGEPQPMLPFELIDGEVVQLVTEVLASIPHPMDVFTQGLEVRDGLFYESAGLYGESRVRVFDTDGNELRTAANSPEVFGEGLTLVGDRMIQITWREQTALVWDIETLRIVDRFRYEGEGWGICLDEDRLIMSDGTPTLTFRDPSTFAVLSTIQVTLDGRAIDAINELECIGGYVVANIWQSDLLVIIDPRLGDVVGLIDATNLRYELIGDGEFGVLNGIAYDVEEGSLYLTGKNWPTIFEVRLRSG